MDLYVATEKELRGLIAEHGADAVLVNALRVVWESRTPETRTEAIGLLADLLVVQRGIWEGA